MNSESEIVSNYESMNNKTETSTDVNIPDRSKLIEAATVFLNNTKMRDRPLHLKRSFLESKGLTSSEIDMAFNLSEVLSAESNSHSTAPAPPTDKGSMFKRVKGFVISTVAFTGTALAVFEIFQRYISPWLVGESRDWQERLIEGQTEINENMAALVSTINDLRRQVAKNGEDKLSIPYNEIQNNIEIREDLKALKSIMLGRNQFPPIPQSRPTLPTWQLENKTANGRSDLEMKYFEKAVEEVLIKNRAEHCNGDDNIAGHHGDDKNNDVCGDECDMENDSKPTTELIEVA